MKKVFTNADLPRLFRPFLVKPSSMIAQSAIYILLYFYNIGRHNYVYVILFMIFSP